MCIAGKCEWPPDLVEAKCLEGQCLWDRDLLYNHRNAPTPIVYECEINVDLLDNQTDTACEYYLKCFKCRLHEIIFIQYLSRQSIPFYDHWSVILQKHLIE